MNHDVNTENLKIIQRLKDTETLFVLISICTKEPYVVCDPETYDDEVMVFFDAEDARKEAGKLVGAKIPVNIAKLEKKQMLLFYTSLYTLGVNAVVVRQGEEEWLIQLTEFIKRQQPGPMADGKVWVENPALHLIALYYMQEFRRQPGQADSGQLQEWQEEITNNFRKGSFIVPMQKEGNGIPLIKLSEKEVYQTIFTDILEFQRFNQGNNLRPLVVPADKIPQTIVPEAMGVLLNPMGVRMPLQIKRAEQGV